MSEGIVLSALSSVVGERQDEDVRRGEAEARLGVAVLPRQLVEEHALAQPIYPTEHRQRTDSLRPTQRG